MADSRIPASWPTVAEVPRLVLTCSACPTQYDLLFPDGRYGYFRYRSGVWQLEVWPNKAAFESTAMGARAAVWDYYGDALDGSLSHSEFLGLLEYALPIVLQRYEENPMLQAFPTLTWPEEQAADRG